MLNDLVFVLRYIKSVTEEYNLPDLYTNYANALTQISQSSTEELQNQLKDYKERIQKAHKQLEPKGWSYSQIKVFDRFGAKNVLGDVGYANFQKALSENAANTPGAVKEINQLSQGITQLLTNATNIISGLGTLGEEEKLEENLSVIQIVFDEEVAIDDLPQLHHQSKEWERIIRAFSLLADVAPEKTKIISISKGTPLSILLVTIPLISKAIYHVVKSFIELWHEILEIKESAIKIEKIKVELYGEKFDLFEKIDKYSRERITEIIETVVKNYHLKGLDETKLNYAKASLLKAGPDLYNFITKGGKVDTAREGENKGMFGNFQLGPNYQDIYKFNENVKKLLTARVGEKKRSKIEKKINVPKEKQRKLKTLKKSLQGKQSEKSNRS